MSYLKGRKIIPTKEKGEIRLLVGRFTKGGEGKGTVGGRSIDEECGEAAEAKRCGDSRFSF